jgi:hypothetical protein
VLNAREFRLLSIGEVLRVLPDREPGSFELSGELLVACFRASLQTSRRASVATRSRIPPTVRHATRISSATAVFDVLTASHAT